MFLFFEIFLIFLISTFAQNVTIFQPGHTGIRVRFNEPLFSEAAQIFHSLFAYRVNTVQIPQQQQCFPEGCFSLHNFRVTSFRQPRLITLKPLIPNYLLIDISNFDLDILGVVSGNLQIVLPLQIFGGIVISTKSLSITATLDLQKNQYRNPYLRAASCELRGGFYDARVIDLGLLTESINIRYKQEMIGKAREVIRGTICSNLDAIIKAQINSRLEEIPQSISVSRILEILDDEQIEKSLIADNEIEKSFQPIPLVQGFISRQHRQYFSHFRRVKRSMEQRISKIKRRGVATITEITRSATKIKNEDEDYDLWGHSEDANTSDQLNKQKEILKKQQFPDPPQIRPTLRTIIPPRHEIFDTLVPQAMPFLPSLLQIPSVTTTQNFSKLLKLLDLEDMKRLFIDLDFIDSISGPDYFSVGIGGLGFTKSNYGNVSFFETQPKKLRFPGKIQKRNLDLIVSEFTPNSILYQAHRLKLLKILINSKTPTFGKLLRTTCSPDEICLSDTVSEVSELYPNRQLDLLIETVKSPKITVKKDILEFSIVGIGIFYLSNTQQVIGKIPFSTIIQIGILTRGTILQVNLKIKELEILEDLDFFNLPAKSLNGFRDGIKGTIETMAKKLLFDGIDLTMFSKKFSNYGLSNFYLEFLEEKLILLQADVDVFKLAFDNGKDESSNVSKRKQ